MLMSLNLPPPAHVLPKPTALCLDGPWLGDYVCLVLLLRLHFCWLFWAKIFYYQFYYYDSFSACCEVLQRYIYIYYWPFIII